MDDYDYAADVESLLAALEAVMIKEMREEGFDIHERGGSLSWPIENEHLEYAIACYHQIKSVRFAIKHGWHDQAVFSALHLGLRAMDVWHYRKDHARRRGSLLGALRKTAKANERWQRWDRRFDGLVAEGLEPYEAFQQIMRESSYSPRAIRARYSPRAIRARFKDNSEEP